MFKRNWTNCSKYVYHFRLNSQHNRAGGGGGGGMSMRAFTLIMTKVIYMNSRNYEESGYRARLGFANDFILVACFISYKEVGEER